MPYPLRFEPNYCWTYHTGEDEATFSNTKPISWIYSVKDLNLTQLVPKNETQRYNTYKNKNLTFVNLSTVPFVSSSVKGNADDHYGSVWLRMGDKVKTRKRNIQWRVSTDGINYSSWYSDTANSVYGSVKYFNFWWNEENVYYIQFKSSENTAWTVNYDAREYATHFVCDSNYSIAVEGYLNSIVNNSTNIPAFAFRELFSGQESASIIHARNLVHDCYTNTGRQCYAYMFRDQTRLLTAPLYWNCNYYSTSYNTSYNQLFRGMFYNCPSLLIGIRNFKDWQGDCYDMYYNCQSLRFMFKCFRATGTLSITGAPDTRYWDDNEEKLRIIQATEYYSYSPTWPSTTYLSNWWNRTSTSTTAPAYWGLNPQRNNMSKAEHPWLPTSMLPVAENNY